MYSHFIINTYIIKYFISFSKRTIWSLFRNLHNKYQKRYHIYPSNNDHGDFSRYIAIHRDRFISVDNKPISQKRSLKVLKWQFSILTYRCSVQLVYWKTSARRKGRMSLTISHLFVITYRLTSMNQGDRSFIRISDIQVGQRNIDESLSYTRCIQ